MTLGTPRRRGSARAGSSPGDRGGPTGAGGTPRRPPRARRRGTGLSACVAWLLVTVTVARRDRRRRPRRGHPGGRAGGRARRPRLDVRPARARLLAVPAALLLRRAPRNAVSWVVGGHRPALGGRRAGAVVADLRRAERPPAARRRLAFWLVQRFGAWLLLGLPLLLLLYPDGRLPTGRWRPAALLSLASTALLPTLLMVVPSEIADARAGTADCREIFRSLDLDPDEPAAARGASSCRCCGWPSRWRCWASSCRSPSSCTATGGRRRRPPADALAALGRRSSTCWSCWRRLLVPGDPSSLRPCRSPSR